MKFTKQSCFAPKVVMVLALSAGLVDAALNTKMVAHGKKYFGNIIDLNTVNNTRITNIIKSEFGAVTPEYSWKWHHIHPERNSYSFNDSDVVADWAEENGKLIRGHTLLWHQNVPNWVDSIEDPKELKQVINDHVASVVGRYKGKIYAWDVVNEVFEENGRYRDSVFYRLLKEDFVDIAFKAARRADPDAKLYINEYNLDYPGPKIDALVGLVERLIERGTPIDGIGTQSHLALGLPTATYRDQLTRLANISSTIDVAITELDIRVRRPVTAAKLEQQRREYEGVTRACLEVPKCVGISLWGVTDKNSWVPGVVKGFDAPNAWDERMGIKPAYRGIDVALQVRSRERRHAHTRRRLGAGH